MKLDKMKVKLDECAFMPERAHDLDVGYDLRSPFQAKAYKRGFAVIDTGVHVQIPRGFVGLVLSKSGLNVKHGIQSHGVIDPGYTGSIVVRMENNSYKNHYVNAGDKIAQLVIVRCETPEMEEVDDLEETERGENGFGSTGN